MKRRQNKFSSIWNRRWFALDGRELKYFKSKRSDTPSSIIDLLSIQSIRPFEKDDQGMYSFVIKAKHRTFMLRTDTEGDMKRWVRGLQEQKILWENKIEKQNDKNGNKNLQSIRKPKHYREEFLKPSISSSINKSSSSSKSKSKSKKDKDENNNKQQQQHINISHSKKDKSKKTKDKKRRNSKSSKDNKNSNDGWTKTKIERHTLKNKSNNNWVKDNAIPFHDMKEKVEKIRIIPNDNDNDIDNDMDWNI